MCTCANVYVRVAEFGMMIRMWVEACAFFGNVGRVGVVGICVSMKDECETKAKSETAIFILLARIVCRHTLPRQAASSSGWSCSEQMCPTVCYVFTLLCRFIFWFGEVSCFGTVCLLLDIICLPTTTSHITHSYNQSTSLAAQICSIF